MFSGRPVFFCGKCLRQRCSRTVGAALRKAADVARQAHSMATEAASMPTWTDLTVMEAALHSQVVSRICGASRFFCPSAGHCGSELFGCQRLSEEKHMIDTYRYAAEVVQGVHCFCQRVLEVEFASEISWNSRQMWQFRCLHSQRRQGLPIR